LKPHALKRLSKISLIRCVVAPLVFRLSVLSTCGVGKTSISALGVNGDSKPSVVCSQTSRDPSFTCDSPGFQGVRREKSEVMHSVGTPKPCREVVLIREHPLNRTSATRKRGRTMYTMHQAEVFVSSTDTQALGICNPLIRC